MSNHAAPLDTLLRCAPPLPFDKLRVWLRMLTLSVLRWPPSPHWSLALLGLVTRWPKEVLPLEGGGFGWG